MIDFSRFTFRKYYRGREVFFDFNLKTHTGHSGKSFTGFASIKTFLEKNSDRIIYLTLDQTPDFCEEGEKLVVNLRAYQNFWRTIAQNSRNRFQAFLAQKLKHYSEEDKKQVIAESTEKEIVENINPIIREKIRSTKNPDIVDSEQVIVVNDQNKKQILEEILTRGYSNDFWDLLRTQEPQLTDSLSAAQLNIHRKKIVDELKQRLTTGTFSETSGDDSWQKWIYKHNWLFGINYQEPIQKVKINIAGVMPDYIFPTLDGFADILEIKLPSVEVVEKDSSHPGSWVWSNQSNYAIGQVVNYLCEIGRLRLEIERQIEIVYQKKFPS
ncbi:MAG: Shedu anti-phage system protein SduA domain-containing protein [Verrucomicrobiota bacterium]|jgi:hypothetical protein